MNQNANLTVVLFLLDFATIYCYYYFKEHIGNKLYFCTLSCVILSNNVYVTLSLSITFLQKK